MATAPCVREVVRRLDMISHFQVGGTEGCVGLLDGAPCGGSEEAGAAERGAIAAAGQGRGDFRGDAAHLAPRCPQQGAALARCRRRPGWLGVARQVRGRPRDRRPERGRFRRLLPPTRPLRRAGPGLADRLRASQRLGACQQPAAGPGDQGGEEAHQDPRAGPGAQREGAGRGGGAAGVTKKRRSDLGGRRGRMISTPDRQAAIALIDQAKAAGARRAQACAELGLDERTCRRWRATDRTPEDRRPTAPRPAPSNKLSEEERRAVLDACDSRAFESLPPSQIVPRLADQGRYVASEASFYRILRAAGQQHHRGRPKPPARRQPPTRHRARGPCDVWSWDITWMPGPIRGVFFYLYLILDIYSRKIVGWEVHERESAELAADLVRKAVWAEGCLTSPLVLHADNGSPMKGAPMKATLERRRVIASYRRPRVSDDNPFSEALLRTCKHRPDWPTAGFASKDDAQRWVSSFVGWYNNEHHHSAIRFVTPNARHTGQDRELLA